jgi:hypothetical protein
MSEDNKSVFGIYKSKAAAENGVNVLKTNGFQMKDISLLLPKESGSQELTHVKTSKAPEGAVTGAGTGAILGGVLGLLFGIGSIAIPGVGPFIAAGPLMTALAGLGFGGTLGIVSGALVGFGFPEYEAQRYEGFVKEGGILISVHVPNHEFSEKAKNLLKITEASDISVVSELKSSRVKPYQVTPSRPIEASSARKIY